MLKSLISKKSQTLFTINMLSSNSETIEGCYQIVESNTSTEELKLDMDVLYYCNVFTIQFINNRKHTYMLCLQTNFQLTVVTQVHLICLKMSVVSVLRLGFPSSTHVSEDQQPAFRVVIKQHISHSSIYLSFSPPPPSL